MENKEKVSRQRSPNYPAYSLRDCVNFLNYFYSKYKTSEAHVDDAVTSMGHSATSSTANRLISAMESFGLLVVRGSGKKRFVKASNLAQSIILTEDENERLKLIRNSALSNDSILKAVNKWGSNLPTVTSVQKSLQLEMNYSGEGAKRFANVIVDTYDFAQLRDMNSEIEDELEASAEEENCLSSSVKRSKKSETSNSRSANLLLKGEGRQVVISVPDHFSPSEFDLLMKWLEIQKPGLVVEIDYNDDLITNPDNY